ncbi:MAG: hypothetical protein KF744_12920 [Taibaiella sp.]|nr:hypothetical protein [Taibaiella sp.]
MNRPLSIPPQPHSRLYRIVVAMGLTLLAAEPATAQRMSPMDSVRAVYMLTGVQMAACNNGGFGTLFCEVRGDRYLPLHGAIVRITYEGKQIAFRETDSTGTMQFLLEPGLYSIRATYARYADTTIAQTIKIAANEITVAHLDFPYKTPRGGQTIVTGEVMDSEPVEHKAKAKTRNKRKADR